MNAVSDTPYSDSCWSLRKVNYRKYEMLSAFLKKMKSNAFIWEKAYYQTESRKEGEEFPCVPFLKQCNLSSTKRGNNVKMPSPKLKRHPSEKSLPLKMDLYSQQAANFVMNNFAL